MRTYFFARQQIHVNYWSQLEVYVLVMKGVLKSKRIQQVQALFQLLEIMLNAWSWFSSVVVMFRAALILHSTFDDGFN